MGFRRDMLALDCEADRNFQVMQLRPGRRSEKIPELARELVAHGVSVIYAGAGLRPSLSAERDSLASHRVVFAPGLAKLASRPLPTSSAIPIGCEVSGEN
jgi:phosphoribosylcarboxyaminoimidazole (NCAIR) mutase